MVEAKRGLRFGDLVEFPAAEGAGPPVHRGCGPGSAGWLRGPDGGLLGSGRSSAPGAAATPEDGGQDGHWGTPRGRVRPYARGGVLALSIYMLYFQ